MPFNIEIFTPHVFALVACIFLFEYFACHNLWLPKYFQTGITCFYFKFKIDGDHFEFPVSKLENAFVCIWHWMIFPLPSILFKALSKYECAFREELRFFAVYRSVMHGIMVYDPSQKTVIIRGKLSYFPIIFLLIIWPSIVYFGETARDELNAMIWGPILYCILFVIQWVRYLIIGIDTRSLLKAQCD